jgi:hypothetical protein
MSGTKDTRTFTVRALDGTQIAAATEPSGDSTDTQVDFDGTRVAWTRRPCSQVLAVLWDVTQPPPPASPRGCTRPTVGAGALRVGRSGRVAVRLRCPRSAPIECAGHVVVRVRVPGGSLMRHSRRVRFALRPGASVTVRPLFAPKDRRVLRRTRARAAVVVVESSPDRRARRTTRFG